MPFPPNATLNASPFKVSILDATVNEMKQLLKASKLAPETYESSFSDGRYGVTREWMIEAKYEWENHFDWRKAEERINSFAHYTAPVADDDGKTYIMHFVALFSEKPDAVPLILLHGWPGSFLEFLPILDHLRTNYTASNLPYHVVVPSLPGYTFSSLPTDKDCNLGDVARIMRKLMTGLGFGNGYIAQGGDLGSSIARILAITDPSCKALHLNVDYFPEPDGVSKSYSTIEADGIARRNEFSRTGYGYALEHGTRPSTIGFVLASSPLALLAWIGEKFLELTDVDLPLETVLESVSLYWLTETFPRSIYPYRGFFSPQATVSQTDAYIDKPFGFSWFPKESNPVPKEWIATRGNLIFFRQHTSGGHFAALERPEVLLKDIEDFIAQVWDNAKNV